MARPPSSLPGRARRAWRSLTPDRRLAAAAALALFLALFLPWYQETGIAHTASKVQAASVSLSGWAAFSWPEAAVLLVAFGLPVLLFLRAEGWDMELPGLDGGLLIAAGGCACLFVLLGIFDAPTGGSHGVVATTAGIDWGIFVALAVAATLTYAGIRVAAADHRAHTLPLQAAAGSVEDEARGWTVGVAGAEDGMGTWVAGVAGAARSSVTTRTREATVGRDREAAPTPAPKAAVGRDRDAAPTPARDTAPTSARRPAASRRSTPPPAGRPARRSRPAAWAEPVSWEEPAVLPEPPGRIVPIPPAGA